MRSCSIRGEFAADIPDILAPHNYWGKDLGKERSTSNWSGSLKRFAMRNILPDE
jgi:hypothetical protein